MQPPRTRGSRGRKDPKRPAESHRWALDNHLHIPRTFRNSNSKIRTSDPRRPRFYRSMRRTGSGSAAGRPEKEAESCHATAEVVGADQIRAAGAQGKSGVPENGRNSCPVNVLQKSRRVTNRRVPAVATCGTCRVRPALRISHSAIAGGPPDAIRPRTGWDPLPFPIPNFALRFRRGPPCPGARRHHAKPATQNAERPAGTGPFRILNSAFRIRLT